MRVKIELLLSAVVMFSIACAIAYAKPGKGWKCQGTFDCKKFNCYNAGYEGYSCGLVTAVPHAICQYTGMTSDSCDTVTKKCALVTYYVGGPCDNNRAPYCPGLNTGMTKDLTEDGCDP